MPVAASAPAAAAADRATPPQRLTDGWTLARDADDSGRASGWATAAARDAVPARVPGCIQQHLPDQHGVFWYWCRFRAASAPRAGERALLRFAAVDYRADCWLNGVALGGHEGGETPFTLDATGALDARGENLLAVRVLNPIDQPIDGVVLKETAHRNKYVGFQPGNAYNYGGIIAPVELAIVPAVRVDALWLKPQADGRIAITATIVNDTGATIAAELTLGAAPSAGGDAVAAERVALRIAPGTSAHDAALTIASPRAWDIEDPFLYRVTARLAGDGVAHASAARCGFRDFRVVDGFFRLNGRRLWLRSTHTGNQMPVGQVVPQEPDLMRRDLIMAKASGYNCVRFISGVPYPEQLDFCDELGLLVYEENLAAWNLADGPKMAERFDASLVEMIVRDRNHPCVAIWGLLNETPAGAAVAKHATKALPLLRRHDPTRLVLLSSGRWDGWRSIGSVSNPGETTWSHQWGSEAPDAADHAWTMGWDPAGGYVPEAGDAHTYPRMPFTDATLAFMRGLGDAKPVFLSEFGVASQFNAIEEAKGFGRYDGCERAPDRVFIEAMAARFAADWTRWGFDALFPFAEDFLRASSLHMARQRRTSFDLVRANPKLCGYNLTGMLDHAHTGEGMWTLWRRWKPGAIEVLQDGWAPLRWCLFAPRHVHAGEPFAVEAVLADDAALPAGDHPVRVRIFAAGRGAVWERRATVHVPAGPRDARPLAWPVLAERVGGLPPGTYTIAADLERGGIAGADRLTLRVSEPAPALGARRIAALGVAPEAQAWLAQHGVTCAPFAADGTEDVVLVGEPTGSDADEANWAAVRARAQRGATVVFASAEALVAGDGKVKPLGDEVVAKPFHDWLYHHDGAVKPHAITEGLEPGLLDWDAYGPVAAKHLLPATLAAEEVVAAGFAVGYCCPGGYVSGPTLAVLRRGGGRIVVSTLRTLPNLGAHPVAGRLLINLLAFAARR